MRTGFLVALLFGLIGPDFVMAEEKKILRPVFYIESQNLARFSSAVGYVFSIENETAYLEQNADQANFVFVSISGLIVNRKIQIKFLDMFSVGVARDIVAEKADSDECYIQEFTTSTGRKFILGLNEPNNGPEEIDRKCFLAALSFFDNFKYAAPADFDRASIVDLTANLLERLNN